MPQWTQDNMTGLIVPEGMSLAKRMERQMMAEKQASRGKFFSNYSVFSGAAGLGYEKPANSVKWEILKQAKENSMIDALIIMARVQQMKVLSKRVIVPGKQLGFRVVHENHADPNYKPDSETIRRCKEVEKIIDNVNPQIHTNGFVDFGAVAMEQLEAYDRLCMVITQDRTGAPSMYHLVDGTTVRPMLEVLLQYMQKNKISPRNKEVAIDRFYHEKGADLSNAAYVQVVNGEPVATWTKDEMSVYISNPSIEIDKWAYGAGSHLERSLALTNTWLNAWAYNDGLFNQDSPEAMLMLYGDVDPVGLGAFQRQVLDQSGSGDYQKVPIVQADDKFKAELIKIRELPKDIQFAEFLRMVIQLKTAAYRAHPSIVNFSIDKGGQAQMSIGNSSEDGLLEDAEEEGFHSAVHGIAGWLTRTIVKPRYDDLVMIFDVDLEDEHKRIELVNTQLQNAMTFNEARRATGLKGDLEFGDIPANAVYVQAMQAAQQQAQQEQMQQQAQQDPKKGPQPVGKEKQDKTPDDKQKQEKPVQKSLQKNDEKIVTIEIIG